YLGRGTALPHWSLRSPVPRPRTSAAAPLCHIGRSAHRYPALVPRPRHRSATLVAPLTGTPPSYLGRGTALPHWSLRSPVDRPRTSAAAPLCHIGRSAHRYPALVPRPRHRSATLVAPLTGTPPSYLGRGTALPHWSLRSPVPRPRTSAAAPLCHIGRSAHRYPALVPRPRHRSATLVAPLTGRPASYLGRGTALPHWSLRSPVPRPRTSAAAPLCHIGRSAHRYPALVPRPRHRSATLVAPLTG